VGTDGGRRFAAIRRLKTKKKGASIEERGYSHDARELTADSLGDGGRTPRDKQPLTNETTNAGLSKQKKKVETPFGGGHKEGEGVEEGRKKSRNYSPSLLPNKGREERKLAQTKSKK